MKGDSIGGRSVEEAIFGNGYHYTIRGNPLGRRWMHCWYCGGRTSCNSRISLDNRGGSARRTAGEEEALRGWNVEEARGHLHHRGLRCVPG